MGDPDDDAEPEPADSPEPTDSDAPDVSDPEGDAEPPADDSDPPGTDAGEGEEAPTGTDDLEELEEQTGTRPEDFEPDEADESNEAAGTGEAVADGAVAGSETWDEYSTGGYGPGPEPEAPVGDEEMPLADHLDEMLKRLLVVIAIAGVVSLAVFPFAERLINVLWYSILPGNVGDIARPRLYGILELKLTELKVASLAGVIVAMPVLVYQAYQFMRPGLYPHERRYYLAAIPTSLVLALVGVSFAFFIVLPAVFTYFLHYSQDVATIGFALGRTFDLILLVMGYLAVVFQIPLFIMLAMMMGLVTREWLAARRLLFWGSFLGISFLFSPDPTGMAPIIIAVTMIVLFEGTLLLTKWSKRGQAS